MLRFRCVSTLVPALRRPLAAVVTAEAASSEPEADPGDEFEQRVDVGEEAAFLYSKHSRALLAALYGDLCYLSDVLRSMKPFQLTDLSVACALVQKQVAAEVRRSRGRRGEHRRREAQRARSPAAGRRKHHRGGSKVMERCQLTGTFARPAS